MFHLILIKVCFNPSLNLICWFARFYIIYITFIRFFSYTLLPSVICHFIIIFYI